MSATTTKCQVSLGEVSLDIAIDAAFSGQSFSVETPKTSLGLAIVAHPHPLHGGTRDNKVVMTIARALTNHGFHVLRPNFRGVGESTGSFDEGVGESRDLFELYQSCLGGAAPAWWPHAAAFQWPVTSHRVLAGFSFGAFVQTLVAQQIKDKMPVLALVGLAVARFPVANVGAGSLVVHGELDDVVTLSDVLNWARPTAQVVTVIPGAGHFFHGQLICLKNIVSDHLVARYNSANV